MEKKKKSSTIYREGKCITVNGNNGKVVFTEDKEKYCSKRKM